MSNDITNDSSSALKKREFLMTPETRLNHTLPLLLHIATATTGLIDAISYRNSSGSSFQLYSIIVLTACAMGIRNATVRKMAIPDLTTTVLTLTITGLAADSRFAGGTSPRWRRRLLAVLLMFFGAAIGTLLLRRSLVWPLATATLLSICCVAISMKQRDVSARIATP